MNELEYASFVCEHPELAKQFASDWDGPGPDANRKKKRAQAQPQPIRNPKLPDATPEPLVIYTVESIEGGDLMVDTLCEYVPQYMDKDCTRLQLGLHINFCIFASKFPRQVKAYLADAILKESAALGHLLVVAYNCDDRREALAAWRAVLAQISVCWTWLRTLRRLPNCLRRELYAGQFALCATLYMKAKAEYNRFAGMLGSDKETDCEPNTL